MVESRSLIIGAIKVLIATFSISGCCLVSLIHHHSVTPAKLNKCLQSVVRIRVVNQPEQLFEGLQTSTGFFCSAPGLLLTSAHVLVSSEGLIIYVEIGNDKVRGEVVAIDKSLDAALIQIELDDSTAYPPPLIFTSNTPSLGESILIPGFPKNEYVIDNLSTVTEGVVSATKRKLKRENIILGPFIQVDAYTSDGYSGAPVLNSRGQVIGMVNYILSTNQGIWLGSTYVTPADKLIKFLEHVN